MGYLMNNGNYRRVGEEGKWTNFGLNFTYTFKDSLRFKKAKNDFWCCDCHKKKPKKTRYIGKQYEKVCFECATKWLNESINSFKEVVEKLEEQKIELTQNESKWKRDMLLGAILSDGE